MPVPPDIRDHAYRLFTQEVPDLLQAIESDLLKVAQEKSLARVHNLMRVAHSIKGGAASVGLEVIASLAHRLENIFKALYSDELEIDIQLESQLLQAYDCLRLPLMQQVMTGKFDVELTLAIAEPVFGQIETTLGEVLQHIDHYDIPVSAQLGVDMSLSILEIDVAEQLDRLAAAIATGEVDRVEAELRSQVEVLIELAEILNKPGLGRIATTVLDAVNAHPKQALQIAPLALANFQAYRESLLASQGKQEIAPSDALLAWTEKRTKTLSENSFNYLSENNQNASQYHSAFSYQIEAKRDSDPGSLELNFDLSENIVDSIEVFGEFTEEIEEIVEQPKAESILERSIAEEALRMLIEGSEFAPETIDSSNLEIAEVLDAQFTPNLAARSHIPTENPTSHQEATLLSTPSPLQTISTQIHQEDLPIAPQITTRVDADQLEQMNNLVNEAVIKRSSLSLQNEQIQKTVRDLLDRFTAVERTVTQLRKVSDRTLIPNPKQDQQVPPGSPNSVLFTTGQFDTLELDHYGTLHALLQEFLEDLLQLRESADDIALFARRSDKSLAELRKSLNYLQDDFMWVRMLPIGEVLNRFPRILRDLSATYAKPVKLQLSGTEVLVDRTVIEHLYDPLLHLLRNAFDHGIEPTQIRQQRGKPEQGLIQIKAFHRGGHTIIEVKDDGEGLNLQRIRQRSVELGILPAQQLATITDDHLSDLIFEPGFSTASQISELSGRGMGLDVVRTQLRALKGTIAVTSQPGKGTTFTLCLPLTLTSDKLLICLAGFTALALPSDSIHEIFVPRSDQVIYVGEQGFLQWRQEVFPIYRLSDLLEYAGAIPEVPLLDGLMARSATTPASNTSDQTLIIISWRQKFAALSVDQLITEQKLVIKPFGAAIAPPNCLYGCTILGDGSVVPVVDGAALIDEALERNTRRKGLPTLALPSEAIAVTQQHKSLDRLPVQQTIQRRSAAKILVVDDAVALRQTLALTLENAGYHVLQAGDGWEATRQLLFDPSIALVICDIEMPNMNGFDFMNYRRQAPALEQIPLIILTSRSNDKHRRLALHLGATAYLTKPYIEKQLLQEIQSILNPIAEYH